MSLERPRDPSLPPGHDAAGPPASVAAPLPTAADGTAPPPAQVADGTAAWPLAAEGPHRPPSVVGLVAITFVSAALDLATKHWATLKLSGFDPSSEGARRVNVAPHLDFIFAQNPGGAWSLLRGLPELLRRPFFLVVSSAAILFILSVHRRVRPEQRALRIGLPLALGGAIGNLVDRIRYGWVVDFIDVYADWKGRTVHWPTFNVADIAIVVGVGLMAIDLLGTLRSSGSTAGGAAPDVAQPNDLA